MIRASKVRCPWEMHIPWILRALAWAFETANEYSPRLIKSSVQSSRVCGDFDLQRFDNSNTIALNFGYRLHLSHDHGENWHTIDAIKNIGWEDVDSFHQDRVFVSNRSGKNEDIYVVEDQGKSWRRLALPDDSDSLWCHTVKTHPTTKRLLLVQCTIKSSDVFSPIRGQIMYGSNDAGRSFTPLVESSGYGSRCIFAASSKDSTLESDGIYCIQQIEESEDPQVQSSTEGRPDSKQKPQSIGTLFYTTNLGKTKKVFDELDGLSVERILPLPFGVGVLTSEGIPFHEHEKLWISRNGFFQLAHLPSEVDIWNLKRFPGNDEGRLLLDGFVKNNEDHARPRRYLISDISGLNFSFWDPVPQLANDSMSLRQLDNLKGSLWGRFEIGDNTGQHGNRLRRTFLTKCSFDNGKTWANLKVIDPSKKNRHIFKCDINDVEHCAFQEGRGSVIYSDAEAMPEPTAGILIKSGTVGETYTESSREEMTFISRDGGASWELLFEYPVRAALLDYGNIIIAVREESNKGKINVYTGFSFSLDQGRTWGQRHFGKPIYADDILLDGWGLKAVIQFAREDGEMRNPTKHLSYTVDFSNIFGGVACTEENLERWYLSDGKCIDGKRYYFDRRKPASRCLMRETHGKLKLHEERCNNVAHGTWKSPVSQTLFHLLDHATH